MGWIISKMDNFWMDNFLNTSTKINLIKNEQTDNVS